MRVALLPLTLCACLALPLTARATHYGPIPKHWHAPTYWLAQAVCIHDHEGAWNDLTGNGYAGGMQFLASTWESVGGPVTRDLYGHVTHWADVASPREQLYRAYLVWDRDSGRPHDGEGSWREWGTAGRCGV